MNLRRRGFCSAVAVGATTIASSPAAEQSEIQISGSIDSAVDADVEGVELFFQQVETNSVWTYTVPASGEIDFTVTQSGTHRVRLFNTSSRIEDIPFVYSFGDRTVDESGSSFDFTIPQAYDTEIRCVDDDGNPVEGLPITLRAGGTGEPSVYTTSKQGHVKITGTTDTTLQLAGSTEVEIAETDDAEKQSLGTVDVTEPTEVEFVVSNPDRYTTNIQFVEADPDAGFNYPYFLYAPPRDETESELPLLVQPNNSGTSTDDYAVHRQSANERIRRGTPHQLANELTVPTLVPVFPRPRNEPVDFTHYTHHLDVETLTIDSGPLERIDRQLINMIQHAREALNDRGYPVTDDGVLLNGFSAAGTFSDRFTVLYPEEVLSVTAGGLNGMALLPFEEIDGKELPYHVGIANTDDLIGKSPDLDALDETRQFLYMGGDDEKDTIPYDDAWTDDELRQLALDVYGEDMVEDRFPRCETLYEEAGIDATFKVYDGVGHTPEPAFEDIVSFHAETVASYKESDETEASSSESNGANSSEQSSGSAPGFGIGSGIAAVGATGYMLKRGLTRDSE